MLNLVDSSEKWLLTSNIDLWNWNTVDGESNPPCSPHSRIERAILHEPSYKGRVEYST